MYHVYVLKSFKDGRLYAGVTANLSRRVHEHSLGKVRLTRGRADLPKCMPIGHRFGKGVITYLYKPARTSNRFTLQG